MHWKFSIRENIMRVLVIAYLWRVLWFYQLFLHLSTYLFILINTRRYPSCMHFLFLFLLIISHLSPSFAGTHLPFTCKMAYLLELDLMKLVFQKFKNWWHKHIKCFDFIYLLIKGLVKKKNCKMYITLH